MENNQIFIDACLNRYTERTPLWIMRQAGRYLPEYRKIRKKYTFHQMMHTPTIMSDVTLLPLNRFDFDAAIMFSDILVIPEALGMKFELKKGIGPVFENEIKDNNDIANLNFDPSILRNIYDGISLIRKNLKDTTSLIKSQTELMNVIQQMQPVISKGLSLVDKFHGDGKTEKLFKDFRKLKNLQNTSN